MSNTPFVESLSDDPVERAIARKVSRMLNDTTLDRQQRETLVRKAQRELIEHRRRKEQQQKLLQQVAAVRLPQGYKAHSVAIGDGRVQVSGLNRQKGLVWMDVGNAPPGMTRQSPIQVTRPKASGRGVRKDLAQSLAERRKALGYGQEAKDA